MMMGRTFFYPLVLLAIGAFVFMVPFARLFRYAADDTFISLRYAMHLAQGHGLVYNVGERVEGYTNFLWTLILAIPLATGIHPVLFLKIVIAMLAIGTALVLFGLGRSVIVAVSTPAASSKGKAVAKSQQVKHQAAALALAAVPGAIFLSTPTVFLNAADGLETMLFVFLLVLSAYWFLTESDPGAWPRSAVTLALLAMTRPDGVIFAPWFLGVALFQRRSRTYLLRFTAMFAGLFVAYWLGRWIYYGEFLPNTYYAKGGGGPELLSRGWGGLVTFVGACGGWAWVAAVPALVATRTRRVAIFIAGIVLLRLAFQVWSGGPWQGHDRFMIPALPFVYLLIVAGLAVAIRNSFARWAAVAAATAILITPGWRTYRGFENMSLSYAASLSRAHVPLGLVIRDSTAADAVIAMDDAGVGPFIAERTNIDMLGLNDAHIAHLPGRYLEKYDVAYVLSRRPDLVVLLGRTTTPRDDGDFRLPGHAALFRDATFRATYELRRSYMFGPRYHLLVFRRTTSVAVPTNF